MSETWEYGYLVSFAAWPHEQDLRSAPITRVVGLSTARGVTLSFDRVSLEVLNEVGAEGWIIPSDTGKGIVPFDRPEGEGAPWIPSEIVEALKNQRPDLQTSDRCGWYLIRRLSR